MQTSLGSIYNVQCVNKELAGKWHNDTATAINNNNNNNNNNNKPDNS